MKKYNIILAILLIGYIAWYAIHYSEQGCIQRFATEYVDSHCSDYESYSWNGIQKQKDGIVRDGKVLKYAQVTFKVKLRNGLEHLDTLYLLVSEDCSQLYAVSENRDPELMPSYESDKDVVRSHLRNAISFEMNNN